VARVRISREELLSRAEVVIHHAQEMTHVLMEKGIIAPAPGG
jgi:hypothetical protein